MNTPLERVSERLGVFLKTVPSFEAHGNPLRTLVREAAQNSWDARLDGETPVFCIDISELSADQSALLIRLVGEVDIKGMHSFSTIAAGSPVMMIRDIRTTGLDGSEVRDPADVGGRWWRFVGNYGDRAIADQADAEDADGAGGSFGLGKFSYFGASESRLIIIHTHFLSEDGIESRFLIYGLGDANPECNYTGRHWWGRAGTAMGEAVPMPVTGDEADGLAAALGLPRFDTEDTGTTFAIINGAAAPSRANSGSETIDRGEFIRECVLWNLWPKYSLDDSKMEIRISNNGRELDLSDPETHPVAKHFVSAYRAAAATEPPMGTETSEVAYNRRTALRIGAKIEARTDGVDSEAERVIVLAGGPTLPLHHVMLVRDPRLVVEYRDAFPAMLAEEHPIAAVAFPPANATVTIKNIGLRKVDEVLRKSEPEAHDRWDAERTRLKSGERSFVAHVLRQLDQQCKELHERPVGLRDNGPNIGLGRKLAAHFIMRGRLYPPGPSPVTSSVKKPSARLQGTLAFVSDAGWVTSNHPVDVNFASYAAVTVSCAIAVDMDGGGSSGSSSRHGETPTAQWVIGDEVTDASEPTNIDANSDTPLVLRITRRTWHSVTPTFKVHPIADVNLEGNP